MLDDRPQNTNLLGQTVSLQPQRVGVEVLLEEGGESLRDPGLGPVQRPDDDSEPGVTHLVADLDVLVSVTRKQAEMKLNNPFRIINDFTPGGQKHEVRRSKAETTEASMDYDYI